MKIKKKHAVGNEIDSCCLKCNDVTRHTIILLVDGKVPKVQCKVCRARHNYRPAEKEKAEAGQKKNPALTPAAKAKLARAEAQFDKMLAKRDPSKARTYSMTDIFKKGDLIDHHVFGMGVVTETVMPNKIEVLFRRQSKMLVCGRLPFRH